MAEPAIQYCRTSDGISVAYYDSGSGFPFVWAAGEGGGIESLAAAGSYGQVGKGARAGMRIVMYDGRGMGSSDRSARDFSLEARLRDLDAVVSQLELKRIALIGMDSSTATAVAWAARHPEVVSRLILINPHSGGGKLAEARPRTVVALLDAVRQDGNEREWELYTLLHMSIDYGFEDAVRARRWAERFRRTWSRDAYIAYLDATHAIEFADDLPRISMPTLVMMSPSLGEAEQVLCRQVAAGIVNARLVRVSIYDQAELTPEGLAAVAEFMLGNRERVHSLVEQLTAAPAPVRETGRDVLRTILFTDIESNTDLLQRLGDQRWRALLREHEQITREHLAAHGGVEIKTMGDGFMASFASATRALDCAIALQHAFDTQEETAGRPLRVRIGINAGEPIAENQDLFGTAVTIAARIMAQAKGGEVLVSDVVRQLVAGKEFLFAERGEAVLRGFDDPMRLYELRLPGRATT